MSELPTIPPLVTVGGAAPGPAESRMPLRALSQEDFLKLLVAQMTSQDPLQPDGDMQFMSQMASFTSLEQTRAMVADLKELRMDQELLRANALIGRTVEIEIDRNHGISWFGTVNSVHVQDGSPKVEVGGRLYDLSQLKMISLPGAPA
jgi:flagellar basal-body rod modification protein FlgD